MRRSALNRGMSGVVLLVLVSELIFGLLSEPLGLSHSQLRAVLFTIYMVSTGALTLLVDRRFWPAPLAYAAGLVLVSYRPELRDIGLAAANVVLLGVALRSWMLPPSEWTGNYRGSREPGGPTA